MVNEFIPPDYSGSGFVLYRYANRLHLNGRLAFILTLTEKENKSKQDPNSNHLPSDKIKRLKNLIFFYQGDRNGIFLRLPKFIFFNIALSFKTFLLLFINRKKFDIIRCFGSGWLSLYVIITSKILRKKIIIDLTSLGADDPSAITKNDKLRIIYYLRKLQYKLSDKIICLSPALVDVCIKSKISQHKIVQIPRSVDIELYSPLKKVNQEIKDLVDAGSQKVMLYVGSFGYDKGADILVETFKRFYKKNKQSLKLIVLCESLTSDESLKYAKSLNSFCKKNKIKDSLFLFENVTNVNEYMNFADILIFPSRREGLPNVVLESMSTGLPVISSKLPGITDYLIDDENDGLIIKNTYPENYLVGINKLINNELLYKRISDFSRKKIIKNFSNEVIDLKLDKLYKDLLTNA